MKKFLNKKLLFILALFLFFILINSKPSYASDIYQFDEEIYITDTTMYNYDYIQACIDAGQSPIDAAKNILDEYHSKYPETVLCSSSDLPNNAFVVRSIDEDAEGATTNHFYIVFNNGKAQKDTVSTYGTEVHMILSSEKYEDGSYSESCDFYFLRFDKAGFALSGSDVYKHTGDESVWLEAPYSYARNGYAELVASNFDVVSWNTGAVVFQPPTLRKATTLAPVIQREETQGTLQGVLTEIIQILPLIILVLVSFLGLRKALKMLFAVLCRS